MKEICIQYHKTKIGELILGSFADKLCLLDFNHRKMRKAVDHRIKKGLNADIVIFDESTIIDKATYDNPRVYPEGIVHVFVDGDFAVKDGKQTDLRAGKVAKRS